MVESYEDKLRKVYCFYVVSVIFVGGKVIVTESVEGIGCLVLFPVSIDNGKGADGKAQIRIDHSFI